QNLERQQWQRPAASDSREDYQHLTKIVRKHHVHKLGDVRIDRTATFNSFQDGFEIVVSQHDISRFFGHFSSASAHRNADVRAFECRCIVDSVAGDGDDFARLLQCFHDPQFLFGGHTSKDVSVAGEIGKSSGLSVNEIAG